MERTHKPTTEHTGRDMAVEKHATGAESDRRGQPPPQGPTPLIPQPTREPRGMHPALKAVLAVLTALLLAWAILA